jgi:Na+-transporting NADH:ubiquinone oxidoreductase subunit E
VNCAILGACLFAVTRDYPFTPNLIYVAGSGFGWWLAIALMAAIREKLASSNIVPGFRGMGITFVMTGFMSMAFMGFTGVNLARPTGGLQAKQKVVTVESESGKQKSLS